MGWLTFPKTVTVHTAGVGVDEYGNPTPSAFTSSTAAGDIQPVTTDEIRDGLGAVASDEVRFYLEPGTVVTALDRLEVDGVVYEVLGPADTRSYSSALDYVRVRAKRTT